MLKGQCKVCKRVFEGETREEITEAWSEHNEKSHKSILQSTTCCCELTFNEEQFV